LQVPCALVHGRVLFFGNSALGRRATTHPLLVPLTFLLFSGELGQNFRALLIMPFPLLPLLFAPRSVGPKGLFCPCVLLWGTTPRDCRSIATSVDCSVFFTFCADLFVFFPLFLLLHPLLLAACALILSPAAFLFFSPPYWTSFCCPALFFFAFLPARSFEFYFLFPPSNRFFAFPLFQNWSLIPI